MPLWLIAGWLPALIGRRAVYATIDVVETFVDRHYEEHVCRLPADDLSGGLRALLIACQADEVHHRDEARAASAATGTVIRAWARLVGIGSALAVAATRRI